MRALRSALTFLILGGLTPACSLLFDGSGFRSGGGADAGLRDAGGRDVGVIGCGTVADPACPAMSYCDLALTSTCQPGCDEPSDCGAGRVCNFATNQCRTATMCVADIGCGPEEYCGSDSMCVPCDSDRDRWADEGASGSCLRRPGFDLLGGGDCQPGDGLTHPFATPDCNPGTDETCGTGIASIFPEVFEVGLVGAGALAVDPDLQSLQVFALETDVGFSSILLLYRTAATGLAPQYTVIDITDGVSSVLVQGPLPGWDALGMGESIISSGFAAVRDDADGVYVASVDLVSTSSASSLSLYRARVTVDTVSPTIGATFRTPRLCDGNAPQGILGVVGSLGYAEVASPVPAAYLAAAVKSADGVGTTFDYTCLLGITNDHEEVAVVTGMPLVTGVTRGSGGSVGGALVGSTESQLIWWNGGVAADAAWLTVDSSTSNRAGIAGTWTEGFAGTNGIVVGAGAGGVLNAQGVRCDPFCTVATSAMITPPVPLGADGNDPLLSADMLAGRSFLVAGRGGASGPADSLVVSAIDAGAGGITSPGGALIPIGLLAAATDLDIGTRLEFDGIETATLDVAFAVATPAALRYGTVRVCARLTVTP